MFVTQRANRVWAAPFVLFLLAACAAGTAQAQPEATPKKGADKAAEIKKLLKERRDTLQQAAKVLVDMYAQGAIFFTAVVQAEREALRAVLEVDDGPEARLRALREYHENASAILRLAEGRFRTGQDNQVGALQAKALVLAAKIELLREELKAKPDK